ncbi:hypothetical protein BD289DRAFT_279868 [Coniella lustricola]|uniref:Uncharacterized protein n=1 Tax=Coniella lustricola TaxID=2025994 RepID=A0A2T3A5Z8_9PEZI|nr:hypothetical protein BD289DRAFT_279868 [Coniella lustricola]
MCGISMRTSRKPRTESLGSLLLGEHLATRSASLPRSSRARRAAKEPLDLHSVSQLQLQLQLQLHLCYTCANCHQGWVYYGTYDAPVTVFGSLGKPGPDGAAPLSLRPRLSVFRFPCAWTDALRTTRVPDKPDKPDNKAVGGALQPAGLFRSFESSSKQQCFLTADRLAWDGIFAATFIPV